MGIKDYFKPYLIRKSNYKGGKGKADVASITQADKIYKMSSNENILGSSPKAIQAITDALGELHYYPDRTDAKIRKALAAFHNHQIPASQYLCANSGMEIIEKICKAFLKEGDEAIACPPAFRAYKLFTRQAGADLITVPLVGDNFDIDVNGILSKVNDKTRLLFLNSPNNPTGTIIPRQSMALLLSRLSPNVIVVYDEVYFHFCDDPNFFTAFEYLDRHPFIGVNSLSKCFGLAGLRVGYMYSNPEISEYLAGLQRPFQLSSLAIEGATAAVHDKDFIKQTVQLIREEKKFLYEHLDKLDVKYWKSQSNFIMIRPDMEEYAFEKAMIIEGVMVRPVGNFGAKNCIRVTIGDRESNTAFINALKTVIKQ